MEEKHLGTRATEERLMEVCVLTLLRPQERAFPGLLTCAMRVSHESWLQPRSLVWPLARQCITLPTRELVLLHKICQALAPSPFPRGAVPSF